jgi:O-antigen/teichoic acid export membrane protein
MSIRRHTIYNLVGQLLPLIVALATIPAYLQLIGEARYGALALVWLFVGYLGLFDLGLGPATAQRLARDGGADNARAMGRAAEVFWTALAVSLMLGLAGALISWPLVLFTLQRVLSVDNFLRGEVLRALPWIVLLVPTTTVCSALTGALQAKLRFLGLNAVNATGHVAAQLLPLATAAWVSPDAEGLLLAVLAARLATMAGLLRLCIISLGPDWLPRWRSDVAADLLRFGGWVTVTAIVGPLMVILDRFAIGALFGAKAVGQYTIPFQLAERMTVLSSALNFAMFPRLAARPTGSAVAAMGHDATCALAVLLSPLIVACVLLVAPFLRWWLTPELSAAVAVAGPLLFAGFWINSLALVPYTELQAQGRPDIVAKCHAAELLPYLALLYGGLTAFGLEGAAAAFGIRAAVDFALLTHFAGRLRKTLRLLLPPACLLAAAVVVSACGAGWLQWAAALVVCACTTAWSIKCAPLTVRALLPGTA